MILERVEILGFRGINRLFYDNTVTIMITIKYYHNVINKNGFDLY